MATTYTRPFDDHDYKDLYDFIQKYGIQEADSEAVYQLTMEFELLAPTLVALKFDSMAKPHPQAPKQKNKNHMIWVTRYGFIRYMDKEAKKSKIFIQIENNYDRITRNRSESKGVRIAKKEINNDAQRRPVGYITRSMNRKFYPSSLVQEWADNHTAYLGMHPHDVVQFFYLYGIKEARYLAGERRDIARLIGWFESKFKERNHQLEKVISYYKLPEIKEYPKQERESVRKEKKDDDKERERE